MSCADHTKVPIKPVLSITWENCIVTSMNGLHFINSVQKRQKITLYYYYFSVSLFGAGCFIDWPKLHRVHDAPRQSIPSLHITNQTLKPNPAQAVLLPSTYSQSTCGSLTSALSPRGTLSITSDPKRAPLSTASLPLLVQHVKPATIFATFPLETLSILI